MTTPGNAFAFVFLVHFISDPSVSLRVFPQLWLLAPRCYFTPVSHYPLLHCVYTLCAPCLQCQFVFVFCSKFSSISGSDSIPYYLIHWYVAL